MDALKCSCQFINLMAKEQMIEIKQMRCAILDCVTYVSIIFAAAMVCSMFSAALLAFLPLLLYFRWILCSCRIVLGFIIILFHFTLGHRLLELWIWCEIDWHRLKIHQYYTINCHYLVSFLLPASFSCVWQSSACCKYRTSINKNNNNHSWYVRHTNGVVKQNENEEEEEETRVGESVQNIDQNANKGSFECCQCILFMVCMFFLSLPNRIDCHRIVFSGHHCC